MNFGDFPKKEVHSPFDLIKKRPSAGDRSLRADDRYQFLEALLSVREVLYISYLGQSQKDSKILPPSVVVSELLDVLEKYYDAEGLVEHHPLYGFSDKYFAPATKLFSYHQPFHQIADGLKKRGSGFKPWWSGSAEIEDGAVDVVDLLQFYGDPQGYFVSRTLGLSPANTSTEMTEESESFDVAGFDGYKADQEILACLLEEGDCNLLLRRLKEEGKWPIKGIGDIIFFDKLESIGEFSEKIKQRGAGERINDIPVDLQIAGQRITGKLSNIYENGILLSRYANLRGKDMLRALIHHLLAQKCGLPEMNTSLIMKDEQFSLLNDADSLPSLEMIIKVFKEGCRRPSPLLVEPGVAYCRQMMSKRATIPPLLKARSTFLDVFNKGYHPSWQLLYGNRSVDEVVDESFEEVCREILLPLWSRK